MPLCILVFLVLLPGRKLNPCMFHFCHVFSFPSSCEIMIVSLNSLWQQAGRSGRRSRPSLAIYVAFEGPLDQYFMKFPDKLFKRPIEHCQVDGQNQKVSMALCLKFKQSYRLTVLVWYTQTYILIYTCSHTWIHTLSYTCLNVLDEIQIQHGYLTLYFCISVGVRTTSCLCCSRTSIMHALWWKIFWFWPGRCNC